MNIARLSDAIGSFADDELAGTVADRFIAVGLDFAIILHPLRHRCAAAYQAGILSAASRAEMTDVEQMKKIFPFVTCEITVSQHVCELMFGINVLDLNFGISINPVKQPIQSNSVGS